MLPVEERKVGWREGHRERIDTCRHSPKAKHLMLDKIFLNTILNEFLTLYKSKESSLKPGMKLEKETGKERNNWKCWVPWRHQLLLSLVPTAPTGRKAVKDPRIKPGLAKGYAVS